MTSRVSRMLRDRSHISSSIFWHPPFSVIIRIQGPNTPPFDNNIKSRLCKYNLNHSIMFIFLKYYIVLDILNAFEKSSNDKSPKSIHFLNESYILDSEY